MVSATRTVNPTLPAETGVLDGLAYSLWLPPASLPPPTAGIVVLHGAGSGKESHHDYARAAVALGLAAVCFDQRGHGESGGRLGAGAIDDVVTVADHLRSALGDPDSPVALRGSSMGGYLAIVAAGPVRAQAVVAICPASAEGLRRGLLGGSLGFDADTEALTRLLDGHDLSAAVRTLDVPLLLMHAEGDEQVPVEHSRELATLVRSADSRLIVVPGGHHRSVQHDPELQAVSLQFVMRVLGLTLGGAPSGRPAQGPDKS
ncbi:MAG TPA: alpha/beta fold hydrolase [Solirubrobacteraceae bacterium]|nr:alpha/beta fold hydrolase [Solirubrobacteraceae bacterium]